MLKLRGYVLTLIIGYVVVFLLNMSLSLLNVFDYSVWFACYYPLIIIVAFFLLDLLAACLVRLIPKKIINVHSKLYKTFKFEKRLYEHLGVRYFKDRIPELGGALTGFSKSELKGDDPKYLEMFLKEMIKGELTHHLCILFGISIFFIFNKFVLVFALPLFLLNTYFNILPVIVQRYNRPKLYKIYTHKLEQQKNKEEKIL